MNPEELIARAAETKGLRASRKTRPFVTFMDQHQAINELVAYLGDGCPPSVFQTALRSKIVVSATSMEVFFHDMFDVVFRTCRPERVSSSLAKLSKMKLSIADVQNMQASEIECFQLVQAEINFQNLDAINVAFREVLGFSLLSEVLKRKLATKGTNPQPFQVRTDHIVHVRQLLEERHRIIHNPHGEASYDAKLVEQLVASLMLFVTGCSLLVEDFIQHNLRVELMDA